MKARLINQDKQLIIEFWRHYLKSQRQLFLRNIAYPLLSLICFIPSISFADREIKSSAARKNRETEKEAQTQARRSNLVFGWLGMGGGLSYLHSVAQTVSLGAEASMNGSDCDGISYGEFPGLKCSFTASNFLAQAAWLSKGDEGLLFSIDLGVSYLQGSLEMPQGTDSISAFGPSLGFKAGYVWTLDNNLVFGFLANFVGTTAKLSDFKQKQLVSSTEVFKAVDDRKAIPSTLGPVLGFAF
jgi:hypothetical protein